MTRPIRSSSQVSGNKIGSRLLKLALNVALPAAGIFLAGLAQLALTNLWPQIQHVPSRVVSIDSYFVVLLALGFCVIAGRWAQQNVATIAGAACALIAPLAWLGLLLSTMMGAGLIAWFRPITLFVICTAVAPLLGVASGWALASRAHNPEIA